MLFLIVNLLALGDWSLILIQKIILKVGGIGVSQKPQNRTKKSPKTEKMQQNSIKTGNRI